MGSCVMNHDGLCKQGAQNSSGALTGNPSNVLAQSIVSGKSFVAFTFLGQSASKGPMALEAWIQDDTRTLCMVDS